MSLLDAHIPQLVASQSAFGAKAGLMRSTIGQAEQEAMSSQAFFAGDGRGGVSGCPCPVCGGGGQGELACWTSRRPTSVMPRARMWPLTVLRRAATPASDPTDLSERFCDVADHVQLPGDAGARRGYGRLCGHVAELGADIASEQAALQAGWQGDTGMSYQAWQAQWNQAMEQLVLSYRAMAGSHENNTLDAGPRPAEGAKWGG